MEYSKNKILRLKKLKTWDFKEKLQKMGASWNREEDQMLYKSNEGISDLDRYKFQYWNEEAGDVDIELKNVKNASILIGREIYGDLTKSMLMAEKEIFIISPYLSSENVKLCDFILNDIKSGNKNLNFKIITSLNYEKPADFAVSSLKELIKADFDIEKEKKIKKLKLEMHNKIEEKEKIDNEPIKELYYKKLYYEELKFTYYIIIVILFFLLIFNIKAIVLFLLISFIFYSFYPKFIDGRKKKIIKKIDNIEEEIKNRIEVQKKIDFEIEDLKREAKDFCYYLERINNLDFKVIDDKKNSNDYLHIKMYIIDDIAYLGSLNFTKKAFFQNIESLIKIEDSNVTEELKSYFNKLYENKNNKEFKFLNNDEIGKIIYSYKNIFSNKNG